MRRNFVAALRYGAGKRRSVTVWRMNNAGLLTFLILALSVAACENTADAPVADVHDESSYSQVENRGADKDNWWEALPRPEWAQYELLSQPVPWFEAYQIDPNIVAIYEPGQFEEVISFLIIGSERALLFDSGLGIGSIRAVVDSLTELDVTVLNSHTHYDHIGGNHQFEHILGRDTDFTRSREGGSTHADVAEFVGEGWVWKDLPDSFDAENFRSQPFNITTVVNEGFEIDLGDRTLEVLITPGHAPDALCLIDRENRQLFTGDSFYLAPLYTHLDGSDFTDYRQTAARLKALSDDVDRVMTAHNVPVVSSTYLIKLGDAFESIVVDDLDYLTTDGHREYDFGDFSIIVGSEIFEH